MDLRNKQRTAKGSYPETTMMTKHLCILTCLVAFALTTATPGEAQAACDSCVSHALPTATTAYYAPAPVARTAYYGPTVRTSYYAPTATAYTSYARPRWWGRWWRTPRVAYYPPAARTAYYPRTAYYAPAATAATGCSTCVQRVNYLPQTSYKAQVVNQPVTTMQPTTIVDGCTGCARTVMRPITTYVQKVQYVPTTVYRPACSTGCASACSTCATANCTGCASCAGGAATIQSIPKSQQQAVPTDAEKKPELRMKPVPDNHNHSEDAKEKAHEAKTRASDFPRLTDPNDRTALRDVRPVRTASWQQAVPAKKTRTHRQVGEGGWYSAK